MTDLIRREDAIKAINSVGWLEDAEYEEKILAVPTIEPKRGEWIKTKNDGVWRYAEAYAECDQCHKVVFNGWKMNFCPNCGARMKGADDEASD